MDKPKQSLAKKLDDIKSGKRKINNNFTDTTGIGTGAAVKDGYVNPRYKKLIDENNWSTMSMSGIDMEAQAYQQQTGGEILSNMALGFGTQAGAAIVDMFGSYDFSDQYDMLVGNTEKKYGNWLTDIGKSLKDYDTENFQIYQDGDNMWNWEYWANQIKNQGYTTGIMIQAMGEQAAMSAITTATLGTGGVAQAASLGNLALRINKLKNLRYVVQGTIKGAQEAYVNALETQETVYNKYKELGYSEEDATRLGAKAAAVGYKTELGPSILLNALQYGAIARYNPFLKGGVDTGYSGAIGKVIDAVTPKFKSKFANGLTSYVGNMVAESLEEGIQTAAGNYGEFTVDKEEGLLGGKTIGDYMATVEMRDAMIGGLIGGGIFKAGHSIIDRLSYAVLKDKSSIGQQKIINEKVETFMKANSERVSKGVAELKLAQESGDQLAIYNAKRKFNMDNTLAALRLDYIQGKEQAFNSQVELMNSVLLAAQNNDTDTLASYGIKSEEDINYVKEMYPTMIEESLNIKAKLSDNIARSLSYNAAEKLTLMDANIAAAKDLILGKQKELAELQAQPEFLSLSVDQQNWVKTQSEIEAINLSLVHRSNMSLNEIEEVEKRRLILENQLKDIEETLQNSNQTLDHKTFDRKDIMSNMFMQDSFKYNLNENVKAKLAFDNPAKQKRTQNRQIKAIANATINNATELSQLDNIENTLKQSGIKDRVLKEKLKKKRDELERVANANISEEEIVNDPKTKSKTSEKFQKTVAKVKKGLGIQKEETEPFVEQIARGVEHLENKSKTKTEPKVEEIVPEVVEEIQSETNQTNKEIILKIVEDNITEVEEQIAEEEKPENSNTKEYIKNSFQNFLIGKYSGGLTKFFTYLINKFKDVFKGILITSVFVSSLSGVSIGISKLLTEMDMPNIVNKHVERNQNLKDRAVFVNGFKSIETKNYLKDKQGNKVENHPEVIVLHHTGEYKKSGEQGVIEDFTKNGGNSAHFLIGKNGKLYQFNDTSYVLYHAGKSEFKGKESLNNHSIGIEIQGDSNKSDFTPEQYLTLITLVNELSKEYKIPIENIIDHKTIRDNYLKKYPNAVDEKGNKVYAKVDLNDKVMQNIISELHKNYPKQNEDVTKITETITSVEDKTLEESLMYLTLALALGGSFIGGTIGLAYKYREELNNYIISNLDKLKSGEKTQIEILSEATQSILQKENVEIKPINTRQIIEKNTEYQNFTVNSDKNSTKDNKHVAEEQSLFNTSTLIPNPPANLEEPAPELEELEEILNVEENSPELIAAANAPDVNQEDVNNPSNQVLFTIVDGDTDTGWDAPLNVTDSMLPKLGQIVKKLYDKYEAENGYKPNFTQFIMSAIQQSGGGKVNIEQAFNGLKEGWKVNAYPQEDFNAIYDAIFSDTKELFNELFDVLNIDINNTPTTSAVENNTQALNEEKTNKKIEEVSKPITLKSGEKVQRLKIVSPQLSASFKSVEVNVTEFNNGDVAFSDGDTSVLYKPGYLKSEKLLDSNVANEGDRLTVKIPENFRDIPVPIYVNDVYSHSIPFGQYVDERGLLPSDQEYMDMIPMLAYDSEGDPLFAVKVKDSYNKNSVGKENHPQYQYDDIIAPARKNIETFRNQVMEKHNLGEQTEIMITGKSKGFYTTTQDGSVKPLSQVFPDAQLLFGNDSQDLIDSEKNVVYQKGSERLDFKEVVNSGEVYMSVPSANNTKDFLFYTNKSVGIKNEEFKQTFLSIVEGYLRSVQNTNNEERLKFYQEVVEKTGFDITSETDFVDLIKMFIAPIGNYSIFEGKQQSEWASVFGNYINTKSNKDSNNNEKRAYKDGQIEFIVKRNRIYVGRVNGTISGTRQVVSLHPDDINNEKAKPYFEGLVKTILDSLSEKIDNSYHNVNLKALNEIDGSKGRSMFTITDGQVNVKEGMSYEQYLKDNVIHTNIQSYNIGTAENPKYVAGVQPSITFKSLNNKSNQTKFNTLEVKGQDTKVERTSSLMSPTPITNKVEPKVVETIIENVEDTSPEKVEMVTIFSDQDLQSNEEKFTEKENKPTVLFSDSDLQANEKKFADTKTVLEPIPLTEEVSEQQEDISLFVGNSVMETFYQQLKHAGITLPAGSLNVTMSQDPSMTQNIVIENFEGQYFVTVSNKASNEEILNAFTQLVLAGSLTKETLQLNKPDLELIQEAAINDEELLPRLINFLGSVVSGLKDGRSMVNNQEKIDAVNRILSSILNTNYNQVIALTNSFNINHSDYNIDGSTKDGVSRTQSNNIKPLEVSTTPKTEIAPIALLPSDLAKEAYRQLKEFGVSETNPAIEILKNSFGYRTDNFDALLIGADEVNYIRSQNNLNENLTPQQEYELIDELYVFGDTKLESYLGETKIVDKKDLIRKDLQTELSTKLALKKQELIATIEQIDKLLESNPNDSLQLVKDLLVEKLGLASKIQKSSSDLVEKAVNKLIKFNKLSEKTIEEVDEDEDGIDTSDSSDNHQVDKNHSKISLEDNSKKGASTKLKGFFKIIKDVSANGEQKKGFLGVDKYMPFDKVWDGIQTAMASPSEMYSNFEAMLDRLAEVSKAQPYLTEVREKLMNADEQTKNEFTYLFARHLLSMKFVMFTETKDGEHVLQVYDTNSNDVHRVIQENWRSNFNVSPLLKVNEETGVYELIPEKAKELLSEFEAFADNENLTNENLHNWLSNFGIYLSNDTINQLKTSTTYYNGTGLSFTGHFVNSSNTPGIFGLMANFLQTRLSNGNFEIGEVQDGTHPFSNAAGALKVLAGIEAKYTTTAVSNSFRDGDKSIYGHTPSKYATDAVFRLKHNQEYRDKFDKPYSKDSFILKLLNENENFRDKFAIEHVGITAFKKYGSKSFGSNSITDLSESDHEATKLGFFQDTKQGEVKGKLGSSIKLRVGRMFFPTMSDKSQMLALSTAVLDLEQKHLYNKATKSVSPTDEVMDVYYDQVAGNELNRIVSSIGRSNITGYDFAAKMFLAHPYLNAIQVQYKGESQNILKVLSAIPSMNQDAAAKLIEETIKPAIKNELKTALEDRVNKKVQEWKSYGFVSNDKIRILDSKYLKKFSSNVGIEETLQMAAYDYIINNQISLSNTFMLIGGDLANYAKGGLKKFFSELGQPYEFSEKFLKDTEGMTDAERYSKIMKGDAVGINLGKRLAILLAPGSKLANSTGNTKGKYQYDTEYIQLFFNDFETVTKNFDFLVKLYYGDEQAKNAKVFTDILANPNSDRHEEAYKYLSENFPEISDYLSIEATDAQEYTTSKEHVDLLFRQGRLTEEQYDSMSTKIANQYKEELEGKPISAENLLTLNEQKLVMQPIKPVYTGLLDNAQVDAMRMLYIKTSSFPLLPQFTKGTELDGLRQTLERVQNQSGKNVRAAFSTGVKVGAPEKALTGFTKDGRFNQALLDEVTNGNFETSSLKISSLVLDRDNFRIQQDVPPKFLKRTEDVVSLGTQVMKLLFGDEMTTLEGFSYGGNTNMLGSDLYTEYNQNWFDLIDLKKNALFEELGLDKAGKPINEEKTAAYLQDLLKREAIDRGYPQQDVDALEIKATKRNGKVEYDFTVPLWLSPNSNRYESLLNAIVTNRLMKIKMPGNSYVVGSETGFKMREDLEGINQSKIIYTSQFDGELKAYTDKNLSQVFLPSRIRDNNGKLIQFVYDDGTFNTKYVYKDTETGRLRLREDKIPLSLLSLPSFRIPTSSHVSMAQIQVVGILPAEVGDLMIVPQNFTKQKGLDFDVDKENTYHLYTYVDEEGNVREIDQAYVDKQIAKIDDSLADDKDTIEKVDDFLKQFFGDEVTEYPIGPLATKFQKAEITKAKLKEKLYKNNIVNIHSSVLGNHNPKVQAKINKVLSMDIAKMSANIIDNTLNANQDAYFSIFDDTYQKDKMALGSSGKLGISVYSNYVVLHSMIQQIVGSELQLTKIIVDEESGTGKNVPLHLNIGGVESDGVLGKTSLNDEARSIAEMLAERQNTATDNEKEQIMGKVNINEHTINFDSLMTLLGYDLITIDDKGRKVSLSYLILSQPGLKSYVKQMNGKGSITDAEFNPLSSDDIIDGLKADYLDKLTPEHRAKVAEEEASSNFDYSDLTGKALFNALTNGNPYVQYKALTLFQQISSQAKVLSKVQQSLNTTAGLGKSFFEVIEKRKALTDVASAGNQITNVDKLIGTYYIEPEMLTDDEIKDNQFYVGKKVNKDGSIDHIYVEPTNPVSKMTVSTIDAGYNLWKDYFPYEHPVIDKTVEALAKERNINGDNGITKLVQLRMQVLAEMKKYLYSNGSFTQLYGKVDPNTIRENLLVDSSTNTSLAKYLNDVLTDPNISEDIKNILKSNALISKFKYRLQLNGLPSLILYDNTVGEQFEEDYLYNALSDLIINNRALPTRNGEYYDTMMLATDLITYSYSQGGVQGAVEFAKYIPISVLEAIGFAEKARNLNAKSLVYENFNKIFGKIGENNQSIILTQIVQHNPNLVQKVEPEQIISSTNETLETSELIKLNSSKIDKYEFDALSKKTYVSVYVKNAKKGTSKYLLFQKVPNTDTYKRIDVLGVNFVNEYQPNKTVAKSLFNASISERKPVQQLTETQKNNFENTSFNSRYFTDTSGRPELTLVEIAKLTENNAHNELANYLLTLPKISQVKMKVVESMVNKANKPVAGRFTRSENIVYLSKKLLDNSHGRGNNFIEQTILHELIHSMTATRLQEFIADVDGQVRYTVSEDKVPADIKDLVYMYNIALRERDNMVVGKTPDQIKEIDYSLKNIQEFVTGVLTTGTFQEALAKVQYSKTEKSIYDKIIDTLAKIVLSITNNKIGNKEVLRDSIIASLGVAHRFNSIEKPIQGPDGNNIIYLAESILGKLEGPREDNFHSLMPTTFKYRVYNGFPISEDTRKAIISGNKTITIRQINQDNQTGVYTLGNGKDFLFKKVNEQPITIEELVSQGYSKDYILNQFGVNSVDEIFEPSVKEWFNGGVKKNVFVIRPTANVDRFNKDGDSNKIPTCK